MTDPERDTVIATLKLGHSHDMDAFANLRPFERQEVREARQALCEKKLQEEDRSVLAWPDYERLMHERLERTQYAIANVVLRNWQEYVDKAPDLQRTAEEIDQQIKYPSAKKPEKREHYVRQRAVRQLTKSLEGLGRFEELCFGLAGYGRETRPPPKSD